MLGLGVGHRREHGLLGVLLAVGVTRRRRIHRHRGNDLEQVVDHDVAQRPHRVIEVAAVLDAEALGHGDLHRRDVVAVPHRLEDRVGEAEVEDLLDPELAQEVVDAVQLGFVQVFVEVARQRPRRVEVMPERLLDHDAAAALHKLGLREPGYHHLEQRGWDLQVEDGVGGVAQRRGHGPVGGAVVEIAAHVGQPRGEPLPDRVVNRLAGGLDGLERVLAQMIVGPVLHRHADDRAVQQAPLVEPIQRTQGHLAGEVAGDAEDDERISRTCRRRAHRRQTLAGFSRARRGPLARRQAPLAQREAELHLAALGSLALGSLGLDDQRELLEARL